MNKNALETAYTALFANAKTPQEQERVRSEYAMALQRQNVNPYQQRQWDQEDRGWERGMMDRSFAEDQRRFDATQGNRNALLGMFGNQGWDQARASHNPGRSTGFTGNGQSGYGGGFMPLTIERPPWQNENKGMGNALNSYLMNLLGGR